MGQPENHNPDESEEPNEPNEFGFAGGATGPEPNLSEDDVSEGEEIAVPAGDITGAIVSAIEGDRERDEGNESDTPQERDRADESDRADQNDKNG